MARRRSYVVRAAISLATDDLTKIKGIGPMVAARLREAGILTFAHLADSTSEDISARVTGIPAKRIAREKWVKQAQKWASKSVPSAPSKSRAPRGPIQHYATFIIELLIGADKSIRRTRITNVQTKSEESWAGWAERRLLGFITKCADLSIPLPEPSIKPLLVSRYESNLLPETVASPAQIPGVFPGKHPTISKPKSVLSGALQISELVTTPLNLTTPQHVVHVGEVFNVRILLDLTNLNISMSTPLNCTTTIWAKKLGAGVRQIVGEQRITFMPTEKIPCIIESRIPSQGTYRLEAMATLTPSSISSSRSTLRAWHEGGMLQVY